MAPILPTTQAAPAEPVGHCTAKETAFFSCTITDGKTLSLCGSAPSEHGWLQYRFGELGKVEFAFPEDRKYNRFYYEDSTYPATTGWELGFVNGAYGYTIFMLWDHNFDETSAGVGVDKDGRQVALKSCTWPLTDNTSDLHSVLSPKPVVPAAPVSTPSAPSTGTNTCDGEWPDGQYPCRPFPDCCDG